MGLFGKLANLGNTVLRGVTEGIKKIAQEAKIMIQEIGSATSSKEISSYDDILIEEIDVDRGTVRIVPENATAESAVEEGTNPRTYKCPIWKYYNVTWVTSLGRERTNDVMGMVADTIVSTGLGKEWIRQSILDEIIDIDGMKVDGK